MPAGTGTESLNQRAKAGWKLHSITLFHSQNPGHEGQEAVNYIWERELEVIEKCKPTDHMFKYEKHEGNQTWLRCTLCGVLWTFGD